MTAAAAWSQVWRALYCCWIATEVYVAVVTRTRRGTGAVRDRGTMPLLWLAIAGSITAGSWLSDRWGRTIFPGAGWVEVVCVGLMAVGLVIRWAAIVSLGRAFSANVAVHRTQRLRRAGLYRWVRHPSYTGLLLILLSIGLRTGNWVGLGLVVAVPMAALLRRIQVEEVTLRDAFGSEYEAYSRGTKRLLPGLY